MPLAKADAIVCPDLGNRSRSLLPQPAPTMPPHSSTPAFFAPFCLDNPGHYLRPMPDSAEVENPPPLGRGYCLCVLSCISCMLLATLAGLLTLGRSSYLTQASPDAPKRLKQPPSSYHCCAPLAHPIGEPAASSSPVLYLRSRRPQRCRASCFVQKNLSPRRPLAIVGC